MKPAVRTKLENITQRHEELKTQLSAPEVTNDLNRFRDLSKEYAQLEPLVDAYRRHQDYQTQLQETQALLEEDDVELQQLAKQEAKQIEENIEKLESELLLALLPKDPNDENNIFLEIRAGTGGDEAAIFAGDLCRMYMRFAEMQRYKIEVLSESLGEHGGYREIIMRVIGQGAYSRFKFESGVHRVQRMPFQESARSYPYLNLHDCCVAGSGRSEYRH